MDGIKLDTDVKRAVAINQCPLQLCESHICPNGPSLCYPTGQPTDNIGPHLHPNTFSLGPFLYRLGPLQFANSIGISHLV